MGCCGMARPDCISPWSAQQEALAPPLAFFEPFEILQELIGAAWQQAQLSDKKNKSQFPNVGFGCILLWFWFGYCLLFLLHHLFEFCLCFRFFFSVLEKKKTSPISASNHFAKGLVKGLRSPMHKYSIHRGFKLIILEGKISHCPPRQ